MVDAETQKSSQNQLAETSLRYQAKSTQRLYSNAEIAFVEETTPRRPQLAYAPIIISAQKINLPESTRKMIKVKSSTTTGTLQQPGDFPETKRSGDLNHLSIADMNQSGANDSQGLVTNSIKTDNILETIVTRNGEAKTPYQDLQDLDK